VVADVDELTAFFDVDGLCGANIVAQKLDLRHDWPPCRRLGALSTGKSAVDARDPPNQRTVKTSNHLLTVPK
jgi:hypothetical protein